MSVAAFLADLRSRDLQVWADGDQLRCNAPTGALTPELREQLQRRKHDILDFLRSADALARQQRAIVPLQRRGDRVPVFAIGGHNGDVFTYRPLALRLGDEQPFYGLEPPGLDGQREPLVEVADLAGYFAAQIRAFQPEGPCVIAGYCAGGTIAFELAQQLAVAGGTTVLGVALFASPYASWYRFLPQLRERLVHQGQQVRRHALAFVSLPAGERRRYISERLRDLKAQRAVNRAAVVDPALAPRNRVKAATLVGVRRYTPRPYGGRVGIFLPNRAWLRPGNALLKWREFAPSAESFCGPDACDGEVMLLEPHVGATADLFRRWHEQCI